LAERKVYISEKIDTIVGEKIYNIENNPKLTQKRGEGGGSYTNLQHRRQGKKIFVS
jgi:hypothetical protein